MANFADLLASDCWRLGCIRLAQRQSAAVGLLIGLCHDIKAKARIACYYSATAQSHLEHHGAQTREGIRAGSPSK
jgi:hypothetical protein